MLALHDVCVIPLGHILISRVLCPAETLCGAESLSRIGGVDQKPVRFGPRWEKTRSKKLQQKDHAIKSDPSTITKEQMVKKFGKADEFFLFV